MPIQILSPSVIESAGNKPKRIEEFVGRVNTKTSALSIVRMQSPAGWIEPGQTPEFDEYTLVLNGSLRVTTRQSVVDVRAGEAVMVEKGGMGAVQHSARRGIYCRLPSGIFQ